MEGDEVQNGHEEDSTTESVSQHAGTVFDYLVTQFEDLVKLEEESAVEFKNRVLDYMNDDAKFTDDDFEAMPEAVQNWSNSAVKARKGGKPLPAMPGLSGDETAAAPKKRERAAKGETKAPKEKKEKKKSENARDPRKTRYYQISEFLIKNPDFVGKKPEEIVPAMRKAGYDYSETTVLYAENAFRHVRMALQDAGLAKK